MVRLPSRNGKIWNLKNREQKGESRKITGKVRARGVENLANKILDEKSTKFTEHNRENIKNHIDPLTRENNSF